MTDRQPGHAVFDELAAGHAVYALEPDEERLFLQHAADCWRCRQSTAEFREVAAMLVEIERPAVPSSELGTRVLAMAAEGSGRALAAGPVIQNPARHRRARGWQRPVAIAAAVALIAGGGVWAGLAEVGGSPQAPLAMCAQAAQCSQVALVNAQTHQVVGKVIVSGGRVWMLPTSMPANNRTDQIYVLWQITGAHVPRPVGPFDVRSGSDGPIPIGDLAAPYSTTWAFAVSLEHGRVIPSTPSRAVALGQVS